MRMMELVFAILIFPTLFPAAVFAGEFAPPALFADIKTQTSSSLASDYCSAGLLCPSRGQYKAPSLLDGGKYSVGIGGGRSLAREPKEIQVIAAGTQLSLAVAGAVLNPPLAFAFIAVAAVCGVDLWHTVTANSSKSGWSFIWSQN